MTADGPAGLRISGECSMNTTAWPCATLLACTWNPALVQQVGQAGAEEVKENNLAVWLTPSSKYPQKILFAERNFEYYSEDPLIAGKMGAAMVKGIQSQHIAASVKHFAANNKEANRKHSDSRVSERALREIYLKGFEIIVKEAQPWTIMSPTMQSMVTALLRIASFWKMFSAASGASRAWLQLTGGQELNITKKSSRK